MAPPLNCRRRRSNPLYIGRLAPSNRENRSNSLEYNWYSSPLLANLSHCCKCRLHIRTRSHTSCRMDSNCLLDKPLGSSCCTRSSNPLDKSCNCVGLVRLDTCLPHIRLALRCPMDTSSRLDTTTNRSPYLCLLGSNSLASIVWSRTLWHSMDSSSRVCKARTASHCSSPQMRYSCLLDIGLERCCRLDSSGLVDKCRSM